MSKNTAKNLTTKYSEFEADRLTFTTLEENERSKGQKIAYPRYNHPTLGEGQPLFIQGPWMTLFNYGVPTLGEFYKEDKDRAFVKVPLDMSNPEIVKMADEFKKIDDILGHEDFKKENFGKNAKKHEYQSIVRSPLSDEDEEVTRPAYMKLKLDLTWPDSNVKTEVFSSELLDNGKRERKKIDIDTVTDFATHMPYMCKFRPVFRPVKMWAHQSKMKDPGYGIVFKLIKVEVEPSKNSNSVYQNYLQGDVFVDDDEEDTSAATVFQATNSIKKVEVASSSKKEAASSSKKEAASSSKKVEDSSDDSDSSDSDSEDEKQVVQTKTPVTKSKGKKADDSDSSDSDSEDEEPVVKAKPPAKKSKGKKVSA